MRNVSVFFISLLGLAVVWWIGTKLSSDAVGMAVGVAFGALAGVPAALLVMAAGRHGSQADDDRRDDRCNQRQIDSPYSAPVIVWHQPAQLDQPAQRQAAYNPPAIVDRQPAQVDPPARRQAAPMPAARGQHVGEREEWIKEW